MENKDLKFIDIHCHYEELSIEHLKDELSKEKQISVTNNIDIDSYRKLENFRKAEIPNLYFAYGLYPDVIVNKDFKDCLNYIEIILGEPKHAIAIGEIGIDYKVTKDLEKRREQQLIFEKQLEIAKANKLPAIIHTRYATKPALDILNSYSGFPIVLHWYSGTESEIQTALDRGYYMTIRFNKPNHPNIIEHLDHIFMETDYPIMFEGNKIEITDIKKSYEMFSVENGIDLETLKKQINNNFNKVFLKKE